VSHYANGQWTTYGSEKLASGESANELVYDVKVAPDGKVWVVTSRSVALFENDAWTIFQEGHRVGARPPAADRRHQGLGLYIVERIVAAHGGTVSLRSTSADGTTFTMRLPRKP